MKSLLILFWVMAFSGQPLLAQINGGFGGTSFGINTPNLQRYPNYGYYGVPNQYGYQPPTSVTPQVISPQVGVTVPTVPNITNPGFNTPGLGTFQTQPGTGINQQSVIIPSQPGASTIQPITPFVIR